MQEHFQNCEVAEPQAVAVDITFGMSPERFVCPPEYEPQVNAADLHWVNPRSKSSMKYLDIEITLDLLYNKHFRISYIQVDHKVIDHIDIQKY